MTKQITVGYDGSGSSLEAVMWAAGEAATRAARLRIVTCYELSLGALGALAWSPAEAFAVLRETTEMGLLQVSGVVATAYPGLEITTEVSATPASSALVHNMDSHDLVVVGVSGHEGAGAFWLGSTPRHIVRHSPCPVVIVPGAANRGGPVRVVVGVDDSPASWRALQWAGDEAERHQVPLLVVHTWLYPYPPVDAGSSLARDLTNVDAARLLDRAVESGREQFAANVTGQLVESSPAKGLLETLRHGDLLVLGSSGRGALTSCLLGSTVNGVLDHCTMPTVVVRGAHDEE